MEVNYFKILWWFLPCIHMNQPWVYRCAPSWPSHPPPSPSHLSGSSQCTSPEHPASCIKPGLAIYFTYDSIHVSMLFSQIIPPSPYLLLFFPFFHCGCYILQKLHFQELASELLQLQIFPDHIQEDLSVNQENDYELTQNIFWGHECALLIIMDKSYWLRREWDAEQRNYAIPPVLCCSNCLFLEFLRQP